MCRPPFPVAALSVRATARRDEKLVPAPRDVFGGSEAPTDPAEEPVFGIAAAVEALHRLDYYQHALAPMGVEHQIRMWLPAPPGVSRYLFVNRDRRDRDFTARDKTLLDLLRPSLVAGLGLVEGREVASIDGLTARESEILAWVARGKTNKEVAASLGVSPNTVRKHLENVFEKLGVHTRTGAISRVRALSTGPDAARQ